MGTMYPNPPPTTIPPHKTFPCPPPQRRRAGEEVPAIGRCRTCKWWRGPGDICPGDPETHTYCGHASMYDSGRTDSAWEDGGAGGIFFGPEFGCVHWEKAE